MTRPLLSALIASAILAAPLAAQQIPTPAASEWWRLTSALSNDDMQGRDTGTEAFEHAAQSVAAQFAADHLQPVGDNGTWFQRVPMHQVDLDTAQSSITLISPAPHVPPAPFRLLYEVTLSPRSDLPTDLEAPLIFIGFGLPTEPAATPDLHGKIAIFFNNTPANLSQPDRESFLGRRAKFLASSGAAALVSIDNPAAIEPFHWPAAYARTVTVGSGAPTAPSSSPLTLRMSETAAARFFIGTGQASAEIFAKAEQGEPLSNLGLPGRLRLHLQFTQKDISSLNILAILRGFDPALTHEYVALSAHLDGYGFGTPVLGDNLYNGALDDAAYVATLLELAHNLTRPGAPKPKRSLLFCIFTGEEKGLLGSQYFTQHPTVSPGNIVADLNLDQLRPIFPLKILTMEGIADSTLGETARTVAAQFNIELRPDREPQRNLFHRADNFNFVRIGVPIASFIFGYNPGTPEEATYRDWYARRYHKPQDDLTTPIDWDAAVKFNDFYRALTLAVADDPVRPEWLPSSPYAPRPAAASNQQP
jgi:hypothetical protein